MGRKPCCEKVGLNRGGWNALEDQILTNYIKANGEGKWRQLPKKAGLKRCGKSCRLRWLNYLSPKIIRGNITQEEEDLIIELHKHVGNRWSIIAARFPGRTDNEIKNYWNTILGKKVRGMQAVPKRKHRKRENGKKPNSSSVPRRRATVQPTQLQHSNSSVPSVTDFPALISESTDAVVTPQNSVTQKENSTDFMGDIMQNIANNSSPQYLVPEEGYNPQQSESVRENNTEFAADTLKSIANNEASGSHLYEQLYTPQDSLQENNTDFMDEIMQYIANMEAPQSHVYDECDTPQQLELPQENSTELMGAMMQNTLQQPGPYPDEITEYMEEIMQNIDYAGGPQSDVYNEKRHSQQQSGSSQASDSTEFMGEKMENISNLESPQGDVYGKCYAQKQSGSSQEECTESMVGITRDIVGILSPERHVYEKCYHELMSDLGTEETSMPDLEDFSVQTYLGIFSELTFTSDESMSEHWMASTCVEQSNTFDLGPLSPLFE